MNGYTPVIDVEFPRLVEDGRRRVDGTRERQFAGMRERYSA